MDMDALGYEPAQVDGFSDDFLMWKPKNENEVEIGFDGWDAVRDFTHDEMCIRDRHKGILFTVKTKTITVSVPSGYFRFAVGSAIFPH